MLPPAVALMGPTASGKTALAMELAQRFPLDIISVDSAMVYRGMDVGTAKPDAQEQARAPHRLIDIADPSEAYSAARFREDALREMKAVTDLGRIPFLVGGTMLYFRALLRGIATMPKADPRVRARLAREAEERGLEALHARLGRVDPESAARIHPNDPQRIQRALEVYELTGRSLTALHREAVGQAAPYRVLKLAVSAPDRARLHDRIEGRFRQMLAAGLVEEVRALRRHGECTPDLPAMRAVGYRQINDYLDDQCSYEEMIEKAVVATRRLAKRQLTWLRSETDLIWLSGDDGGLEEAAERIHIHLAKTSSDS